MTSAHPVLFEQVQTLYKQSTSTFLGTLLAGTVAAVVLQPSGQADPLAGPLLWGWLGAVVLLTASRFVMVRRFFRRVQAAPGQQLDIQSTRRAARAFATGSFMSGCLWGILGLMAFDPQAYVPTLFLGFLLGGMVSGALGSLSVYYPAFMAYSIPSVLPFALRCMTEGPREFAGFGLLTLVFMLVCLGYGRGLNRSLRNSIELRFENAQLVRDLAAARDRAELASADKTALLAAATHDLRQPAYAAGLFASGLKTTLAKAFAGSSQPMAVQAQRMAGQLEASVMAFNGLLEGLLDLAQLDAGATPLAASPLPAGALLDSVAGTLAATAAQRNIRLRVRARPELWVNAPPDALQRIVLNLTSNAIKFTSGNAVLLFARLQAGRVHIGVADTGPGISEAHQQRLFDAFVRLPQDKEQAGLGLGLAIVKRLAAQMGAQVGLKSAAGRGSLFSVALPVYAGGAPRTGLPQAVSDASAGGFTGWQALVLDDDPLALAATTQAVSELGLTVQPFDSAEAALAWLAQAGSEASQRPHLLVTDLHLGDAEGRDGLTVLAAFRAQLPGLRALVVTGETAPAQLQRIAHSGVPVVRKPCQPQALQSALREVLAATRDA
jgi:signal transduction histidine kinase/CheY-like chemotaxis protein